MAVPLKTFQELWEEAWAGYRQRALTLLGTLLVSTLVVTTVVLLCIAVLAGLAGGAEAMEVAFAQKKMDGPMLGGLFLLACLTILAAVWSECAIMVAALHEDSSIIDALVVGWRKLRSFGLILLLTTGIVLAGLLLLVPGIVFAVWFFFGAFFCVEGDFRGMRALQASRAIVRGRFWHVLFKLLFIWFISFVVASIPWVGQLLSLLFTPFALLFLVALYRNLQETTTLPVRLNYGQWLWGPLAVVGMIIPLLGLIGALVTLGPQLPVLSETGLMLPGKDPDRPEFGQTDSRGTVPEREPMELRDVEVTAGAIWRDPVGDSGEGGPGRWLDIQGVTVIQGDEALEITVHLAYPLESFFRDATSSGQYERLVTFYLDTDMNRETGGQAAHGEGRDGYDVGVDLIAEAGGSDSQGGRVHASLFRLAGSDQFSLGPLIGSKVGFSGKTVRFTLPYSLLGVLPGEEIRMCFLEGADKQGSGLAKDKVIRL